MQPAAHIAATIECLTDLFASWKAPRAVPADKLLDRYFRARRYIGSKDRANIGELYYWILRNLSKLDWWCKQSNIGYNSPLTPSNNRDTHTTARLIAMTAVLFRGKTSGRNLATLFDGGKYSPAILTDGEWNYVHQIDGETFIHPSMSSSWSNNLM